MQRMIIIISIAAIMMLGCKSESKTLSLGGEISFFTHRTDKANTEIKKLAEDFQNEHPGTVINIFSYKRAREHLDQLFVAGQLYDVTPVPVTMSKQDFSQHLLAIDHLGVNGDDVTVEGNGFGSDGKLYAVASGVQYLGLIYNRAAFKQAGVTTPPRTFDDLLTACGKLSQAKIIPIELNYRELWTLERYTRSLTSLMIKNANQSVDDLQVQKSIFDSDGAMTKVFHMLLEMKKNQCFGENMLKSQWEDNKLAFANGQIGMTLLETWYLSQLTENEKKEEIFGIFPFPGVDSVAVSPDWAIGISKKTTNPELAFAWLKYILTRNRLNKALGSLIVQTEAGLNPIIAELLAMTKAVIPLPVSLEIVGRAENAGINFEKALQDYLIADEPERLLESYRQQWLKAFK